MIPIHAVEILSLAYCLGSFKKPRKNTRAGMSDSIKVAG